MSKKHVLKVLKENLDWQNYTDGNDSWDDELKEAVTEAIKLLEQHPSDCKIFGTKENCFGGATENECEHCDYKIQKLEQQPNDDCVSRQAVHNMLEDIPIVDTDKWFNWLQKACLRLADLPPVTPTHGTCKDCTNYVVGALDEEICIRGHELIHKDFYCADYKKRGSEE